MLAGRDLGEARRKHLLQIFYTVRQYNRDGVSVWELQQLSGYPSEYVEELLVDLEKVELVERFKWVELSKSGTFSLWRFRQRL